MVSSVTIAFIIFSLFLIFGFTIGLVVYLCVVRKASFVAVLVGALVFLVFQLLTRIPLLQVISQMEWYQAMAASLPLLAIFLSVTAALFEETGRYLAFRYVLKNRLETKNAVAYGVGHGGFEAIVLVGLTYINNLVICLAINSGTYDTTIGPALGASAEMVKNQFLTLPSHIFALGGIERFLTILVHIGLSVLVYYAVRYRMPRFYLYALLAHTLLNFGVVLISQAPGGTWLAEGYVLLFAAASVWLVLNSLQIEARLAPPEIFSAPVTEPE
jgi:uncharacterized membrane protein YhfC